MILYPKGDRQKSLSIPMDFRRYFISLIKSLLQPSPKIYKRFEQDKPGYSPYVFGISFGEIIAAQRNTGIMEVAPPVTVTISTGDMAWFAYFCNGAIALKNRETILGLVVETVDLCRPVFMDKSVMKFSIRGHASLRQAGGEKATYVNPAKLADVAESINMQATVKADFLRKEWGINAAFDSVAVLTESQLKKGVCSHYGGKLTTVRGGLVLAGATDSMQFLYDYGIGVRTGQGFGLLEVMKQYG